MFDELIHGGRVIYDMGVKNEKKNSYFCPNPTVDSYLVNRKEMCI